MSREGKISLSIGLLGLGLTAFTAVVDVNGLAASVMAVVGVLLMLGGAIGVVVAWRGKDVPQAPAPSAMMPQWPPSSFPFGYIELPEEPPEPSPTERLNRALSAAIRLRTRITIRPDESPSYDDDPLFQWAKRAYGLVSESFATYADEFHGDNASLGSAYFGTAFGMEIQAIGRGHYLERRITLLKKIATESRR